MDRKKIIWTIAIIFGLSFWIFTDYHWSSNTLKKSKFKVVSTKTDWTLFKPWTWIKQPITQILWLDFAVPLPYDDNYFIVHIYYKRQGEKIIETIDIIDTNENRFTNIKKEDIKNLDQDTLEELNWIKTDGCMSDLVNYLKRTQVNN